jgi:geranylgeranyl pyrophosphate synthase
LDSKNKFTDPTSIIRERSEKILQRFGEAILSNVTDPKLRSALEDVAKYWRDINRPSLTFFSCEAVGGNMEVAENAALMFTLASSGFGVHDDIIDRSSNKHLRKTILGLHGTDVALLVGDLLIVKGWTITHEMIRKSSNPTKIADVIETYGRLSIEICEAEFMETQCRKNLSTSLDHFENILWNEMAETEVCCRIGAMLGDGLPAEIDALSDFGRRIGFISRLTNEVEDCLNLKGDLLHRIQHESLPLPLLYATRNPLVSERVRKIIGKKHFNPYDAKSLLKLCFETGAFEYMRCLAEKNKAEATLKLDCLRSSGARDILFSLVTGAYERIKNLCI